MAPDSAPPSDSNPGQQPHKTDLPESFGRFRILKLLGQGGMGLVYLADDPKKDRQVALKVLAQEKADNQTLLKRFRSEALATRELKHPNIVGVYEAGSIDGQFYIALEFVDGTDVARLIQSRGRLPVRRSLDVTRQVAIALSVAHLRNIVHRDIKPSNLLIRRDGVVKLTDMGLARSLDDSGEAGITRAGTTVGTVDYISPEQARDSKAADTRSDIYSLGCTWYHMLTGQAPFPDGNLIQKLRHHATTTAPDPRIINDTTPEDVVVVLQRMLLKDPDARFQEPDQLIAALDAIDLDRRELTHNVLAALAEDDSGPASAPPTRPRRTRQTPRSDELDTRKTPETHDSVPNHTTTTDGSTKPAETAELAEPATPADPTTTPTPATSATTADPTTTRAVDESADPTESNTPPNPTAHNPATRHTKTRDRKPSPNPSRKPATPPPSPRSRRAARTVETPEDEHDRFNWERLKPFALVILGGCALSLFVYLFASLGQSVDLSDTQGGGNLFDRTGKRDGPADGDRTGQDPGEPNDNSADSLAYDTVPATTLTGTPAHPPSRPPQLRQGEQRHIFEWVRTSADTALPLLQVVSGQLGTGQFYSLDAALASLGTPGGWIQLHGPGPFFITATTLTDLGHVVITAARRGRAVVVLRPRPGSDNTISILNLKNTSLDLRRLDIVPAARAFPDNRPLTLIASHHSDVRLQGCTITQREHRDGGTTSLAVTGATEHRPTRILLDNVLVRGRSTSLLELDSRNADVALVNCLLVTDAVSPIHVLTPGGAGDNTDRRHVRLLSSTLCSDQPLLSLDCGAAGPGMPSTHVRLVNSLMVCPETGTRVLLDLGRWPQHNDNSNSQSRFLKLEWEQHGCVAFGVRDFIRRDLEIGPAIGSFPEWQACWKTPGEDTAFLPTPWRALAEPVDRVPPAQFDTDQFASRLPPATDGNPPGCRVLGLKTADTRILERADGQLTRPNWTPRQTRPRPHLALKIADHPDLGLYLAQHPPPPHAVIVVEGSGRRETSPVVVDTEGLKLVFRDLAQGTPLVLVPKPPAPDNPSSNALAGPGPDPIGETSTPKPPDANADPSTDTRSTALFTVNGGSLELVGGRFQLPDHQNPIPAWLLKVNAGSFVVRNCSLLGLGTSQSDNQGLIHWSGQQPHATGQIVGSYLIGSGTLLKSAFVNRHLLIDDSLLVSTTTALDLALDSNNPPKRSALDIRHSTISAAKAAFLIRDGQPNPSAGSSDSNHVALDLFIDQTVFTPPTKPDNGSAAQPVLLSVASRHLASGHVRWFGTRNGFHPQLTRLLHDRTAGEPADNSGSVADFDRLFPPPKRIRPLHGPNAVKTTTQTANLEKVRPQHFQLTSDSKAHSSGPGGRPIGANLEPLDTRLGNVGPARSGRPGSDPDF